MKSLPGAIILGVDSPIGLAVVRELGRHGVPVHAIGRKADALSIASRYCTSHSVHPKSEPPADWLPTLIRQTGARAVMAISEGDLLALSALPPTISDCRLLVPRTEQLQLVLDKQRTLEIAAGIGMRVPQSWQPAASDDFPARAAAMHYPLVAKWANPQVATPMLEAAGLEWFKAEYIASPDTLLALLDRFAPLGAWPLIQQYCAGVGLGQMLHMQDGEATLRFQHRRLHEWPPEGGVSTLCRAEPLERHDAQMALSIALLQALDWNGPAMVEYRYDAATGNYWLMEINGRFWGSLPLASHCGATFAWESYRRAILGEDTPLPRPRDDLRARYMIPETKRLVRLLFARQQIRDPYFQPRPLRDLWNYMVGFLDPHSRYYVFSLRDQGPFWHDLRQMAGKVLRRGKP